jgi:hypothetical protein
MSSLRGSVAFRPTKPLLQNLKRAGFSFDELPQPAQAFSQIAFEFFLVAVGKICNFYFFLAIAEGTEPVIQIDPLRADFIRPFSSLILAFGKSFG